MARLQELTVGDVMCRSVVVIPASSTMHAAACLLADRSASCAPVVDDGGRCIGVLSANDFVTFEIDRTGEAVDAHGRHCNAPDEGDFIVWNSVRRFMSTAVQTVAADAPLIKASTMMCAEHIHHLFVLNEASVPIGVISTLDIAAALVNVEKEQSDLFAVKRGERDLEPAERKAR